MRTFQSNARFGTISNGIFFHISEKYKIFTNFSKTKASFYDKEKAAKLMIT